jgi:carbamate kinase
LAWSTTAIAAAAPSVAALVADGHEVVLTHGNGPQVGNLLTKNELASGVVPPMPLDLCVAQTQGGTGAMLLDALDGALAAAGASKPVTVLVSRTLVAADDPAFAAPSKPIGRFVSPEEAAPLIALGQVWEDRGERGFRRVVPSPQPLEILDAPAASALLAAGFLVVVSGGGGVPTIRTASGRLEGVEAVVDKDLTASILAQNLAADLLVIATDVPNAMIDWGSPRAYPLEEVSVGELRRHAAAGEFIAGSMGPKVEAVCRFVEATGRRAAITSLETISPAAAGQAGTRVVP